MTNEFKKMIEELKNQGMDKNEIAIIELINEYLTNEDFKKKLEDYIFLKTYNNGK